MNATYLNLTLGAAAEVTPDAIEAAVTAALQSKPGESCAALFALEALIRQCSEQPETRKTIAERLAQALDSDASHEGKLFVCRQLWQLGATAAAPALSRMLLDDDQVDLACYAIAQDPGPDAGQLLRDALTKADGRSRVAIINLLGDRKDERAVEAIRSHVDSDDAACVEATIAALGKIGDGPAADALSSAHGAGHALLPCAEGLLERGDTDRARAIYTELVGGNEPGAIRKAAKLGLAACDSSGWVRLFDGETFAGWEGNMDWFRIEDGAVVAGSLEKRIPNNEFLCTTKEYADFELRLQVKLLGDGANAGIQIRSQRVPNHHEVSGYQADMGEGYWGALYDESRRNKILTAPDPEVMAKVLNAGDWNDYVIRCVGKRVQLWINGFRTVDYTEADDTIAATGIIGLQIHGGAPSEAWYRHMVLRPVSHP
jgi:3-keto-disaccharide hydrolase/HEAT repeats